MASVSDPEDFTHLNFGLCLWPRSLNEHTCTSGLKIRQIGVRGDTDLEKSLVFSLHTWELSYS